MQTHRSSLQVWKEQFDKERVHESARTVHGCNSSETWAPHKRKRRYQTVAFNAYITTFAIHHEDWACYDLFAVNLKLFKVRCEDDRLQKNDNNNFTASTSILLCYFLPPEGGGLFWCYVLQHCLQARLCRHAWIRLLILSWRHRGSATGQTQMWHWINIPLTPSAVSCSWMSVWAFGVIWGRPIMAHRVNEQSRLSVAQTTVLALPPPNQANVSITQGEFLYLRIPDCFGLYLYAFFFYIAFT